MVVIQIILVIAICLLFLRFIADPSTSQMRAWKKIFGALFVCASVLMVLFPLATNDIAHALGVGRGADLLLYLLTLSFIFVCLNMYIKAKQDQVRMVELSRKIALLEAKLSNNSSRSKK